MVVWRCFIFYGTLSLCWWSKAAAAEQLLKKYVKVYLNVLLAFFVVVRVLLEWIGPQLCVYFEAIINRCK